MSLWPWPLWCVLCYIPFSMRTLPGLVPLVCRGTVIHRRLHLLLIHGVKENSHPISIHRHRMIGYYRSGVLRFRRLWDTGLSWTEGIKFGLQGGVGDCWFVNNAIMVTLMMICPNQRVHESWSQLDSLRNRRESWHEYLTPTIMCTEEKTRMILGSSWTFFAYPSLLEHAHGGQRTYQEPEALNIWILQHIQVVVEVIHWELIHHLIERITPRDGPCVVQVIKDFHAIGGHELVELHDAHLLIRHHLPVKAILNGRSQGFNAPEEHCSSLWIVHGLHYLNYGIIHKTENRRSCEWLLWGLFLEKIAFMILFLFPSNQAKKPPPCHIQLHGWMVSILHGRLSWLEETSIGEGVCLWLLIH